MRIQSIAAREEIIDDPRDFDWLIVMNVVAALHDLGGFTATYVGKAPFEAAFAQALHTLEAVAGRDPERGRLDTLPAGGPFLEPVEGREWALMTGIEGP